ncbi:PAS domain S-box protein, partial [Vibrio sp. FNV 38]|nr:PAS domain S-box protein [Vibrio sp. FNV 38]
LDQQGLIRFINPAWEALSGFGVKSTLQKSLSDYCSLDDQQKLTHTISDILNGGQQQQQIEVKLSHKNGNLIWVECRLQLIKNSRNNATITATIDNIHERKQAELQLRHLAHHDPLTGLHNRYYFDQQLNKICQDKYTYEGVEHAVIYIDLDHFKIIND